MTVLVAVLIFLVGLADDNRNYAHKDVGKPHWRDPMNCGVLAVYALLRAHRITDVSYEQVTREIPLTKTGSNLADMQSAAARFDLNYQTVRCTPEHLAKLRDPFIAHVRFRADDHVAGAAGGDHFVVVLQSGTAYFLTLDPMILQVVEVPLPDFLRLWSGVALISSRDLELLESNEALMKVAAASLLAQLSLFVGLSWQAAARRGRRTRAGESVSASSMCGAGDGDGDDGGGRGL
jgi:predicted double-glycine peptidase